MSAQPIERTLSAAPDGSAGGPQPEPGRAPDEVTVRRNTTVSVLVGVAAAAMGIAYLWRAAGTAAPLDWVFCAMLTVIAAVFLRGVLDARLPLLVADEMGVRIRFGRQWRGLPWEAIDRVSVQPRRGLLRDGRLLLALHHVERAIEGLEGRALRHADLNRRVYGAAMAVPLGLTTRISGAGEDDLADRVAALSQGRTEVVTLLDEPEVPLAPEARPEPADPHAARPLIDDAETRDDQDGRRPRWLRRAGEQTEPLADHPVGAAAEEEPVKEHAPAEPVPVTVSRVRPIARLADPVAPLVIGEFQPEPAYDPVIGPDLAAARTRVGLSVDALAERTRIRPHVIESIEVDDFGPCGGDFYARGHIRTLARVLGKDPAPMLAAFEHRYASAPVNARKVFEAELATGSHSIRPVTSRGPNWALLVGVVLTLVLVWSAVRLFAGEDDVLLENPPPVLNGSAGLGNVYGESRPSSGPRPVPVTVTATSAGATVEVRDGQGTLIFEGDLVIGESKNIEVEPPVTVSSDNGAAVAVVLAGRDLGPLADSDAAATEVFQRPFR